MKFNKTLFCEILNDKGYKLEFVARTLKLTYSGFYKKMNNRSVFKLSEIYEIIELLNLDEKDIINIFFSKNKS